jgi:DNA-binding transcriptional MerR regulator
VEHHDDPALVRIGELSRRLGVSDHVLRAWETRYGVLRPIRSAGGFRLYSERDESRVRRMQGYLQRGLSPAQAAQAALAEESGAPDAVPAADTVPVAAPPHAVGVRSRELRDALDAYDETMANAVLDRLLSELTLTTVLRRVVLPYLHGLGTRWAAGEVSVAQEHFASNLLKGRLAGLARDWGHGNGPGVLLACPPGELHDLPLMIFGIVLGRSGWRVGYLGASTPIPELVGTVGELRPELVVLAATTAARFTGIRTELSALAAEVPVAIAGAGASRRLADSIGAQWLDRDPVTAAEGLTPPR